MRKPIVAGAFYPDDFSELDKSIKESFESRFGPGATPTKRGKKTMHGIISPHAGFIYSGPCAAWAYKEIAESEFAQTYILLGLSHQGYRSCISDEDWETPLGIVKIDSSLAKAIKGIPIDNECHSNEHSIEVQIPFLQFACKDNLRNLRILPIIISPDISYDKAASVIFEAIKETKRKVCVIASSDFTHFGMNYGYFPFRDDIKENLHDLDHKAIEYIKKLDAFHFLDYVEQTGATICGKQPIAVAAELTRKLGAKQAKLLHYYTSGDITKDYTSSVSYASMVICQ